MQREAALGEVGAEEPKLGNVEEHLLCLQCGYDLYGLDAEGNCPECGKTIWTTLRGGLLQNSDPTWLATVRWGVILLLISASIGCAQGLLGILAYTTLVRPYWEMLYRGVYMTSDTAIVCRVIAAWMVTTKPICSRLTWLSPTLGTSIRILSLLAVAARFAELYSRYNLSREMWQWILYILPGTILMVCLFLLLRKISRRIPNRRLTQYTEVVLFAYCLIGLMQIILNIPDISTLMGRAAHVPVVFGHAVVHVAILLLMWTYLNNLKPVLKQSAMRWRPWKHDSSHNTAVIIPQTKVD